MAPVARRLPSGEKAMAIGTDVSLVYPEPIDLPLAVSQTETPAGEAAAANFPSLLNAADHALATRGIGNCRMGDRPPIVCQRATSDSGLAGCVKFPHPIKSRPPPGVKERETTEAASRIRL